MMKKFVLILFVLFFSLNAFAVIYMSSVNEFNFNLPKTSEDIKIMVVTASSLTEEFESYIKYEINSNNPDAIALYFDPTSTVYIYLSDSCKTRDSFFSLEYERLNKRNELIDLKNKKASMQLINAKIAEYIELVINQIEGQENEFIYTSCFPKTTEPVYSSSKYNQEYVSLVAEKAEKYEVPVLIALGVAAQESTFRHCCLTANQNFAGTCTADYSSNSCKMNKVLSSSSNSRINSVGLMQINAYYHKDCFEAKATNKRPKQFEINGVMQPNICYGLSECNNKTVLDVECNIAAGLNHLKMFKSCSSTSCTNSSGKSYNSYTGWDAALRRYNGCGCGSSADRNYVENVKNRMEEFSMKTSNVS
ncbi:MAG: hypothetical protein JW703_02335 [Candidatus Diapherotrites archaeon]|nr:hypothetical protein [Candidatus Diapherotrites archaeon]